MWKLNFFTLFRINLLCSQANFCMISFALMKIFFNFYPRKNYWAMPAFSTQAYLDVDQALCLPKMITNEAILFIRELIIYPEDPKIDQALCLPQNDCKWSYLSYMGTNLISWGSKNRKLWWLDQNLNLEYRSLVVVVPILLLYLK